jgi:hypothetical protein
LKINDSFDDFFLEIFIVFVLRDFDGDVAPHFGDSDEVFEGYIERVAADTVVDGRVVDLDDVLVGRDVQVFEEKKRILAEKKFNTEQHLEFE